MFHSAETFSLSGAVFLFLIYLDLFPFFAARKTAPPIEIEGLPGYERLSASEREVSL